MDKRGSKTQYWWKHKNGLKNVFDSIEKLRYSLRNDANFRDAEAITKQLGGKDKSIKEGGMGGKRAAGYKMKQSKDPYTVKYSAKKDGPVKITVVDGKKAAEKFVKDIKKQGMNGIIKKGWEQPGSTHTIKYNQSYDELQKAMRYDTLTGKK